jgi:hypothetical protein
MDDELDFNTHTVLVEELCVGGGNALNQEQHGHAPVRPGQQQWSSPSHLQQQQQQQQQQTWRSQQQGQQQTMQNAHKVELPGSARSTSSVSWQDMQRMDDTPSMRDGISTPLTTVKRNRDEHMPQSDGTQSPPRRGFFALKDKPTGAAGAVHARPAPMGMSQFAGAPRRGGPLASTGWYSSGKTQQSQAPSSPSPAPAPTPALSLRQESRANLQADREMQSKFKGDKAAGPLLGSKMPIVKRSGVYLNNVNELAAPLTERAAKIPDFFASLHEYRNVFVSALEEEVTLRMRDIASTLYRAMQDVAGSSASVTNCKCGTAAAVKTCGKDNANKGRAFYTCHTRKCGFFLWVDAAKSNNQGNGSRNNAPQNHANISIDLHAPPPDMRLVRQRSSLAVFKCVLLAKQPFMNKAQRSKFSQQQGPRQLDNSTSFLVRVSDEDARGLSGTTKNDLWIVSSSAFFSQDPHASVVMTRSMWFSRSSDGCVELSRISGPSMTAFRDGQEVYCLRGPNIHGGVEMQNVCLFVMNKHRHAHMR